MPKQKTHRGAKKRFKLTATGKVRRRRSMHSHMLTKKSPKRKRRLRQGTEVVGEFAKTVKQLLHD